MDSDGVFGCGFVRLRHRFALGLTAGRFVMDVDWYDNSHP